MIKVLVVDDDFMVARLHAKAVAAQARYQVAGVVSSGAEAIEWIRRDPPDLVLLDIYLPDMTGLEVIKAVRGQGGPDVDVIVISAARDLETLRSALHVGVFHYLVKPFELAALRHRLAEYAEHRAAMSHLQTEPAGVSQADIDRAFRAGAGAGGQLLPKNISPQTLDLVVEALAAGGPQGLSATECAGVTGLSRSSTRRYLDHLVLGGQAVVRPRYGAAGRPERRYHPR